MTIKRSLQLSEGDFISEETGSRKPEKEVDLGFDPYSKVTLTEEEFESEVKALNRKIKKPRNYDTTRNQK